MAPVNFSTLLGSAAVGTPPGSSPSPNGTATGGQPLQGGTTVVFGGPTRPPTSFSWMDLTDEAVPETPSGLKLSDPFHVFTVQTVLPLYQLADSKAFLDGLLSGGEVELQGSAAFSDFRTGDKKFNYNDVAGIFYKMKVGGGNSASMVGGVRLPFQAGKTGILGFEASGGLAFKWKAPGAEEEEGTETINPTLAVGLKHFGSEKINLLSVNVPFLAGAAALTNFNSLKVSGDFNPYLGKSHAAIFQAHADYTMSQTAGFTESSIFNVFNPVSPQEMPIIQDPNEAPSDEPYVPLSHKLNWSVGAVFVPGGAKFDPRKSDTFEANRQQLKDYKARDKELGKFLEDEKKKTPSAQDAGKIADWEAEQKSIAERVEEIMEAVMAESPRHFVSLKATGAHTLSSDPRADVPYENAGDVAESDYDPGAYTQYREDQLAGRSMELGVEFMYGRLANPSSIPESDEPFYGQRLKSYIFNGDPAWAFGAYGKYKREEKLGDWDYDPTQIGVMRERESTTTQTFTAGISITSDVTSLPGLSREIEIDEGKGKIDVLLQPSFGVSAAWGPDQELKVSPDIGLQLRFRVKSGAKSSKVEDIGNS